MDYPRYHFHNQNDYHNQEFQFLFLEKNFHHLKEKGRQTETHPKFFVIIDFKPKKSLQIYCNF